MEYFDVEDKSLFRKYKASVVNITKNGYEHYITGIFPGLSVGDQIFQQFFQETGYAFDFEKSLFIKPIICDSLILLGEQDDVVVYKDILKYQDQFLNSKFVLIENAGHNLQLDERQKVVAEI